MLLRDYDLRKVNSATKYPSIPTYHSLGPNGTLLEDHVDFGDEFISATEKIDGVNSRIIVFPDGSYLIGSREELLTAQGDLIPNPMLGIVDTLRDTAEKLSRRYLIKSPYVFAVFYFEVYGGKTPKAATQYTSDRSLGARLFDVAQVSFDVLSKPLEGIAKWRDGGGQNFLDSTAFFEVACELDLDFVPPVRLTSRPPSDIVEMYHWLNEHIPKSRASLDRDAPGRPEGLVIRNHDRSLIAKARFENYRKHIDKSK